MERIRLDIIPKGLMPVCHASQYDDGRVIRLDLMDGLQGYSLTDEEIELDVRKPDGHIVTASVDVVAGNTYVDIVTTEQMCAVEGENICELKISKDGAEIYSLNFRMVVEKSVLEGGDPSESFIHNLNQQISDAVAEQYTGEVIFDPVPTENHGTGYAVTSEGVANAVQDAKDYTDNAISGLSIPEELNDLSDVNITSPTQGEALVFDEHGNIVNGTVSTVGNLDDLSDVDTTGKATGDSLRYIGNEWKAKPTTVKMTKAEYDAISDFTPYENTHIVITDAPNLNATADDIEYSSGVSVADKLDEMPTKTSDLTNDSWFVGLWTGVGDFSLTDGQTGNLTLNEDISDAREILIGFYINIGTIGKRIRKTLLIPRYDLYYVGMFFDEMATPTERIYFQLDRVDGTHLAISSCSIPSGLSNVGIKIYYR